MRDTTPESQLAMFSADIAAIERQKTKQRAALLAAAKESPVPWDAELIKGIAFQVYPKKLEIYSFHPGFVFQERIEAVATKRKAFYRAVDNLLRAREELAKADAAGFDHIEVDVQEKMFSAANAAFALVEHSRRLNDALSEAGYDVARYKERIAVFCKDPQHNFIKRLRNSLQHSRLIQATSQVTTHWDMPGRPRHSYTVIINKHEIARGEWNDEAKEYIEKQGWKIDVLDLFKDYRNRIDELHTWWQAEIEANAPPELTDFQRVKDMITRVLRIQMLKLLLPNLMAMDVDPYAHWQNYLTSEELEELETMPRHSAQQVDRLIDIADANLGLCNGHTRELVYRLFKVQA